MPATLGSVILLDVIANRPAAGIPGRLFSASDTNVFYRDNGTSWDVYGGAGGGLSNPMTTQGDVIVGGTAGTPTRLAASSPGLVLMSNGSGSLPSYQPVSDGFAAGVLLSGITNPTPFSIVQHTMTGGVGPLAFLTNVTAGSLLVAVAHSESALSAVTLTDTLGNTWTRQVLQTGTTNLAIYYAPSSASGANSVTFVSMPNNFSLLAVCEISGVAATSFVDASASAYNGTSPTSVTLTTATAGDLIFVAANGFHSVDVFAAGAGVSMIQQQNGNDALAMGFMSAQATGAYTPGFAISGAGADNSCCAAIALKPTSATIGSDGNFYLNLLTKTLWGPRTGGLWNVVGTLN